MDCENCRHLTVVGLHDTGPWCIAGAKNQYQQQPYTTTTNNNTYPDVQRQHGPWCRSASCCLPWRYCVLQTPIIILTTTTTTSITINNNTYPGVQRQHGPWCSSASCCLPQRYCVLQTPIIILTTTTTISTIINNSNNAYSGEMVPDVVLLIRVLVYSILLHLQQQQQQQLPWCTAVRWSLM